MRVYEHMRPSVYMYMQKKKVICESELCQGDHYHIPVPEDTPTKIVVIQDVNRCHIIVCGNYLIPKQSMTSMYQWTYSANIT